LRWGPEVRTLTTARAHTGTRLTVSLPQRSMTENEIRIIGTCAMLSATEIHSIGLKTDAKKETASNKGDTMKGTTTIMVPSMINLTDTVPQKEEAMKVGSKLSPVT
jgi:hypothetical protein